MEGYMIKKGEEAPTLKKESKAYPYLKALLEALIEATPNWAKAPGRFFSSLSEQLKNQRQEENEQLENEIESISKDELMELIKEAGCEQKEDIELIIGKVQLIPEILQTINYRFDKVDKKLKQIEEILQQRQSVFFIGEQKAGHDIIQAGGDVIIHRPVEKEVVFPFAPSLHNQMPPEENFVGREEELKTITDWYKNPDVRIGALIGWGGVGKSALVRKWYDSLEANNIRPDGIFWWGFYRNANLEPFLNALLRYVSGGQIEPEEIKGTWEKIERIKEYISRGAYLIILDGLEEMQTGESGDEFGRMIHREFTELLHYLADAPKANGLCLITSRYSLTDIKNYEGTVYQKKKVESLSKEDGRRLFEKIGVKGSRAEIDSIINDYKGHALSLTLLAGYLVVDFGGDIKKAKELPNLLEDGTGFSPFVRILNQYVKRLTPDEKDLMNVLSCILVPIDRHILRCLVDHEVFNVTASSSVNRKLFDFLKYLYGLENRGLVVEDFGKYVIHPLVSNYFFRQLQVDEQLRINKLIQGCLHEDIVSVKAPEKQPVVFLSHNHEDKPFTKKLSIALKKHGIESWIDEGELGIGDSLIEKIQQAIKSVDYFAVILSPNSVNSSWVRKELEVAMNMEIERKKVFVLPILYKECELPLFLTTKLYADFVGTDTNEGKFDTGVLFIVESLMSRKKKP
jgi:hypothetical protein